MSATHLLVHEDVLAWLIFAVVAMALVAYEISALLGAPWRTISWYAFRYAWVRWTVLALLLAIPVWWLFHSGHAHPA